MWKEGHVSKPVLYGHSYWIDESGNYISESLSTIATKNDLINFWRPKASINQPSFFISTSLIKHHPLNESLHYALDWELWLRLSERHTFSLLPQFLSFFRFYDASKSGGGKKQFFREQIRISRKYWSKNTFRYFQTWIDCHICLLKQPFIKIYIMVKNLINSIIGKKNYEKLKALKKTLFHIF
jgi:hypothetical protein